MPTTIVAGIFVYERRLHGRGCALDYGACLSRHNVKAQCTPPARSPVNRHRRDTALQGISARATPGLMRLRRSAVAYPFNDNAPRTGRFLRRLQAVLTQPQVPVFCRRSDDRQIRPPPPRQPACSGASGGRSRDHKARRDAARQCCPRSAGRRAPIRGCRHTGPG